MPLDYSNKKYSRILIFYIHGILLSCEKSYYKADESQYFIFVKTVNTID